MRRTYGSNYNEATLTPYKDKDPTDPGGGDRERPSDKDNHDRLLAGHWEKRGQSQTRILRMGLVNASTIEDSRSLYEKCETWATD